MRVTMRRPRAGWSFGNETYLGVARSEVRGALWRRCARADCSTAPLSVPEQLRDHIRRGLATSFGDPLKSLGILALDPDKNDQLRIGIAVVVRDVPRIELRQVGIEIPRPRVRGLSKGSCS